jgi:polysaccharide biosynthesis transport protein
MKPKIPNHYSQPNSHSSTGYGNLGIPQGEGGLDLGAFFSILRRRLLLGGGVAIVTASAISLFGMTQKARYEGKFQLLVEPVTADSQSGINLTDQASKGGKAENQLDYLTQIQVLRSPKLVVPILEQVQQQYADLNYNTVIPKLNVTQPKETKIIEVRYQDADAQKVAFVLKKLADGYLDYSRKERQTNLSQGIKFVNGQIRETQVRVDDLQQKLQRFRQEQQFIDPESQAQRVMSQITALQQQRLDIEKEIATTQSNLNQIGGQTGSTATLAESPAYQSLLTQLREVETKLAIESARFEDENLVILNLKDQRKNLSPLLQKEANRVVGERAAVVTSKLAGLQVQQQAIANTEKYLNQQVQQLPVATRYYTDIQRQLSVATESLNRFLQTREQLQVQAAQKEVPWQLIAPPEIPQAPITSTTRTIVLGGIAGVLLGIAAAMLAERADRTFYSIEDLRNQIRVPLIGTIPILNATQNRRRDGLPYRDFQFLEAFRTLYSNLVSVGKEQPINSLVISSARPGDGKTTVAINLAQAAAAMGKRVLIIDADLRNPQLSQRLGVAQAKGLSDVIVHDICPSTVIRTLHFNSFGTSEQAGDKLCILPAGHELLDPTKVLSSHRLKKLIASFEMVFDLVIYDAPPMLGLADSNLLAAHTNGMILVTRIGKSNRIALVEALDRLKLARIQILGLVANGVVQQHDDTYTAYKEVIRR